MAQFHHVVVAIERALDDFAIGPIHQHRNRLSQEGVGNVLTLQCNHAVLTCDIGKLNDLRNQLNRIIDLAGKSLSHHAHRAQELPERASRHHHCYGARHHDQQRGGVHKCRCIFRDGHEDQAKRRKQTHNCCNIHEPLLNIK